MSKYIVNNFKVHNEHEQTLKLPWAGEALGLPVGLGPVGVEDVGHSRQGQQGLRQGGAAQALQQQGAGW